MATKNKVECSCGFTGKIDDLLIDDQDHRQLYCPKCKLTGGIEFKWETLQKTSA